MLKLTYIELLQILRTLYTSKYASKIQNQTVLTNPKTLYKSKHATKQGDANSVIGHLARRFEHGSSIFYAKIYPNHCTTCTWSNCTRHQREKKRVKKIGFHQPGQQQELFCGGPDIPFLNNFFSCM